MYAEIRTWFNTLVTPVNAALPAGEKLEEVDEFIDINNLPENLRQHSYQIKIFNTSDRGLETGQVFDRALVQVEFVFFIGADRSRYQKAIDSYVQALRKQLTWVDFQQGDFTIESIGSVRVTGYNVPEGGGHYLKPIMEFELEYSDL